MYVHNRIYYDSQKNSIMFIGNWRIIEVLMYIMIKLRAHCHCWNKI